VLSHAGRFGPRTIALATGSGVLGLLLIVGLVASGTDRNPTDTVLQAPASRPPVPPTSAQLKLGSSVALVVAAPLPQVSSVVGKSEGSAIRNLKNAGFKVKRTTQTRTTGKDDVVLSQSSAGGTRAKPKSVVRIVISNVQRRPDPEPTRVAIALRVTLRAFPPRRTMTAVVARQRTQVHRTRACHGFGPVRPRPRR
jgi:PASTA domain